MQTALYVALSGQMTLDRRLATVANNLANAGTAGYRAEGAEFSTYMQRQSQLPAAFATGGRAFAVEQAGPLTKTGNPLDVAVMGQGYLAIQTPGGTAYTRDGRMQVLGTGDLVTLDGHPVLDAGNAPITLDPAAGTIEIARDGMITQQGKQVGAIGLFSVDLSAGYARYENSALVPKRAATPVLSFVSDGMVQGFAEGSNVNPVSEMTKLIAVTRAFEGVSSAVEDCQSSLKEAIQTLAARS